MNTMNLWAHHRATLKLLFAGALSLVMLIPLAMVGSVVSERQDLQLAAERTIADRWGGSQSVSGLVALTEVPVDAWPERPADRRPVWQASGLSEVIIAADLTTEWRYLGIYRVPIYCVVVNVRGRIDWAQLDRLQPSGDLRFWLPLGDVRGVRDVSAPSTFQRTDRESVRIAAQNQGRVVEQRQHRARTRVDGIAESINDPLQPSTSCTFFTRS